MSVGILGVGHLAQSLIESLLRSGLPAADIVLSPRGKAPSLADLHRLRLAADNRALVEDTDLVLLAVRPEDAPAAVAGLPWRVGQVVVSVCAGVPLEALAVAPAEVVRAMPLTAAAIGASPTVYFPDNGVARDLIGRFGTAIPLASEADFEIATVNAAVYGWAQDLIRRTAGWSVERGADAATMRRLVALTFVAAGRMMAEKPEPMEEILADLVTPGGITELGLGILEARDQPGAWQAACTAVHRRLADRR
ncbi:NAD(P)-binding domain-containing protein [Rhizobium sp. TRM95111]|uniref:pyrroline-5-carboxylate reductase family protein n=1 Tax=Rhizobium alarense TaxID=2846851 RepID=UPI001F299C5B|nr:NAD(P)-binding domain-containing protein [Rhizobium alarense]MCF3639267.1 NAD(P)-binding domain-containing protein [Rhizobium alarense]